MSALNYFYLDDLSNQPSAILGLFSIYYGKDLIEAISCMVVSIFVTLLKLECGRI
jgi:hypothetical protein